MPLMWRMPLAASPQGLGTFPTTTMRTPRRTIASSTLAYANVIVVSGALIETLPPIVQNVDAGAAIAGVVVLVHRHALDLRAVSARDKVPIGLVARHVRARQHFRHADCGRQSF